jgi:hypothetical protein
VIGGVHLTLMVGPAVPVPAPRSVVEALTDVEVSVPTEGPSVFQLRFSLAKSSSLSTLFLISGGAPLPLLRVVLVVTLGGTPQTLIDGVVTGTEVAPAAGGNVSTLTVRGEDLSRVMDYFELDGIPYPALPPVARVALMLAKYAPLGVIPAVVPSLFPDLAIPIERIPLQRGTDLAYIKELAAEAGHAFYLTPGPAPGTSIAYWGPLVKIGVPQPALNIDFDAHTNVESLSFSIDTEQAALPVVYIQNPQTRVSIPIPVPDISPLSPPLGLIPPLPKRLLNESGTARMPPTRAAQIGITRAAQSAEAVRASGSLDVLRYGRLLQPRGLVGVRGGSDPFNGLYYVESVKTTMQRGKIGQSFSLSRNGLLSTVPRVAA